MSPSKASIQYTVRKLRKIIDAASDDPVLARIAYAVETALRWTIEDTKGWPRPEKDVVDEADICKRELRLKGGSHDPHP